MTGVIVSNARGENFSEGHSARETFINKQTSNNNNKKQKDHFGSVEVRPQI